MRITVRNLGVLKEAEIDLKPLTVFIGPNNSGKTWLAYALAGILGPYGSEQYIQAYIKKQVPLHYEILDKAVERVLAEENATINLYEFAKIYGEIYFNEVGKYANTWMNTFLGTQLANFNDLNISLRLRELKAKFLNQISHYSQRSDIGPQDSLLTIRKQSGEDKVFVYTSSKRKNAEEATEQLGEKFPIEEVREQLVNFILIALQISLYSKVYALPTERTKLFNTHVNASFPEDEKGQTPLETIQAGLEALIKGISMVSIAKTWAESSFTTTFSNILSHYGTAERAEREKIAKDEPRVKEYIGFAEVLEKEILTGQVDFSTPEPNPRREVLFQPAYDTALELPVASSMVKELSPLVLYLRHLAQPGELLIIDEPEMNLHPEAQAKIIEFLAMLVNAGLNVLFTTHSPYITDHLTNLIKAYESEDKEAIKDNFFLKRTDAFIAKDKVSVYGFGEGTVRNVLDEEGFINLNTFGEVSERISNIYFAL